MIPVTFKRKKDLLFKRLREETELTLELEQMIVDVYGGRGKRAIDAIKEKRVIKRGKRWFVRGKMDEYEVVRDFCTCKDYVLNIATGKADVDCCYHALAKNICEALGANYVLESDV